MWQAEEFFAYYSLQVNEGSLTGESANGEKNEEVLPEEVTVGRPEKYGIFRKLCNILEERRYL